MTKLQWAGKNEDGEDEYFFPPDKSVRQTLADALYQKEQEQKRIADDIKFDAMKEQEITYEQWLNHDCKITPESGCDVCDRWYKQNKKRFIKN